MRKVIKNTNNESNGFGSTEVLTLFVPSIVLKGSDNFEILIDKQEFTIGRDKTVDRLIDSNSISRKQCAITYSNNRNYVTDLDSSNGTFLNGNLSY
jgi:pSer/pThr/pTyr-binding forkhead associated (FHA) protein